MNESELKVAVLTRGVTFTGRVLAHAAAVRAKGQNLVYNTPTGANSTRPQELLLTGRDGYRCVASCVSPVGGRAPVEIDLGAEGIVAIADGVVARGVRVEFVPRPAYYDRILSSGDPVTNLVSACGLDELNVWPWTGCAISRGCKFCGANAMAARSPRGLVAGAVAHRWGTLGPGLLDLVEEAYVCAKDDPCYLRHLHPILITGNLEDAALDLQAELYAQIARRLRPHLDHRSPEGIVAVTAPPTSRAALVALRQAGVGVLVLNLEVAQEPWFSKYCPGKARLGRARWDARLAEAVEVFGRGNAWTNFVLGLEPFDGLLRCCQELVAAGVVPGANVLHLDAGASLDVHPPAEADVVAFYRQLAALQREAGQRPYYCAEALRTSLANEAFDGRLG